MAIYKLGEIVNFQRGELDKGFSKTKDLENIYPIISAGVTIKGFFSKCNRRANVAAISSSGANAGYVTIPKINYFAADCFTVEPKDKKLFQKYLNYFLLNNQKKIFNMQMGSGQPHVYSKSVSELKIDLPSIETQQKIINIIEPVENLKNKFTKLKLQTIKLISLFGTNSINQLDGSKISFTKQKEQYINSGYYVPTAGIGDFNNNIEKIDYLEKIPSRGRLTFKNDTLYISKLEGERKILYSTFPKNFVLSNGMWGIEANDSNKYILYAFLLSNNFYIQKTLNASGTTMQAINNKDLDEIINGTKLSLKYNDLLKKCFLILSYAAEIEGLITQELEKLIKLLIK